MHHQFFVLVLNHLLYFRNLLLMKVILIIDTTCLEIHYFQTFLSFDLTFEIIYSSFSVLYSSDIFSFKYVGAFVFIITSSPYLLSIGFCYKKVLRVSPCLFFASTLSRTLITVLVANLENGICY